MWKTTVKLEASETGKPTVIKIGPDVVLHIATNDGRYVAVSIKAPREQAIIKLPKE